MRIRKLIAVMLALILVVGCLPACSDTSDDLSESQDVSSQGESQLADQPEKKIRIYTARTESDAAFKVWNDIIEQYQQEVNPNFSVEFESVPNHDQYLNKLRLYITGDELPEIYQIDEGPISQELSDSGKMVNIGEQLKKIGMYDQYNAGCLSYVTSPDGNLYMLPEARYGNVFYYWVDKFEEYGLEEPETFDEFMEICQKLKDAGETPIAVSGKASWNVLAFLYFKPWRTTFDGFISKVKTGEMKFADDPIGVEAANFLYELGQKEYFPAGFSNIDFTDTVNNFLGGQSVMLYTYSSMMNQLAPDYEEGRIGYFLVPDVDGEENMSTSMPIHTGKAWAFNQDLFDEEMQRFFEFLITHYNDACYKYDIHSPLDQGIPEGKSALMTDLYEDMTKQDKCWVAWDAKLDPATSVLMADLAIQLSLGMITPDEFMTEMDTSIAENAPAYFGT